MEFFVNRKKLRSVSTKVIRRKSKRSSSFVKTLVAQLNRVFSLSLLYLWYYIQELTSPVSLTFQIYRRLHSDLSSPSLQIGMFTSGRSVWDSCVNK